ncbi:carboxymuconolactone decarboxylase family protein [Streptomyces sp. NPDC005728]|uniref:carboxymuconolactone decarboxylase family protein n=1 Tax=Streptomyces sp. NPDC005728 TaxID=3157054 RepID=UPI0033C12B27
MEPRLNLSASPIAGKAMKYIASASRVIIAESTLPSATQHMVKLRASQINGCGFCTDAHTKDLLHEGESPVRVSLVAAWRESNVFTDAERAALELTEQGTRVADAAGGVTDEAWAEAAKHYNDEELVALVLLISLINTSNRLGVICKIPGGDYQPGQFDAQE